MIYAVFIGEWEDRGLCGIVEGDEDPSKYWSEYDSLVKEYKNKHNQAIADALKLFPTISHSALFRKGGLKPKGMQWTEWVKRPEYLDAFNSQERRQEDYENEHKRLMGNHTRPERFVYWLVTNKGYKHVKYEEVQADGKFY